MGSEQRAARNREASSARLALPAGRAIGPAAVIASRTAAFRAKRLAIGFRPAQAAEHRLGFRVGHAHDLSEIEALGGGGKEEVLTHDSVEYDTIR